MRAGQAQFKHLLEVMPDRFAVWEQQEEKMQDFLGVEVTILSKTVKGTKQPLSLRQLRETAETNPAMIDMSDVGVSCNCTSSWSA